MGNPFTTIQNKLDARREQKSQERFEKYISDRKLTPFQAEMLTKVQKDLFPNPEVGDETTVNYFGSEFRIVVTSVEGNKVQITAQEIHNIPTLNLDN